MRNVVVMADGTGNGPARGSPTNVRRLGHVLDLSDSSRQEMRYIAGVGTETFWPKAIVGNALGVGVKRNVLELYRFLCKSVHGADDRIYLFGFSRGAYTVLVLAALLEEEGLLCVDHKDELSRLCDVAYSRFIGRRLRGAALQSRLSHNIVSAWGDAINVVRRRRSYGDHLRLRANIAFLGLWDAVDAYGLPVAELRRAWHQYLWALHVPLYVGGLANVGKICHALSLDDERATFHPILLDESIDTDEARHVDELRVAQVWFPGVHSDVGGGYTESELSLVSLRWMITEASKHGLLVNAEAVSVFTSGANPFGQLHDSRQGFARYFRYGPRDIASLARAQPPHITLRRPKIHHSVLDRLAYGVDDYAPIGIPAEYVVVGEAGDLDPPPSWGKSGSWRVDTLAPAWNLVWWGRCMYWAALLATLYLVTFPILHPPLPWGACQGRSCFASDLLRALLYPLRGIVPPWAEAYASHPDELLICLLVIWLCWRTADTVITRMRRFAGYVWSASWVPEDEVERTRAARLPHWRLGAHIGHVCRHVVLPSMFVLAVLGGALLAGARGVFEVRASNGMVCRQSAAVRPLISSQSVRLRASEPCSSSGAAVAEGRTYVVTLVPTSSLLSLSHLNGEAPSSIWRPLFRWPTQPRYTVVARIGAYGSDEYPLPALTSELRFAQRAQAEFTARTAGELFVFLNDVVLFRIGSDQSDVDMGEVVIEPVSMRLMP